jgi:signal transduction histidine kinase
MNSPQNLAARTLAASNQITKAALAGEDPETVLQLIVRSAATLAEADLGLLMSSLPDGRMVVEAAAVEHGSLDDDPIGIVLSARSAAAKAARSGNPTMATDLTVDWRTAPFVPEMLRGFGPFAVGPFGGGDRRYGALAVYRKHGAAPFSDVTIQVLQDFAAQAGLVLLLTEGASARERIAVYKERENIARDLHDVVVQRLYAAGMQLDLLDRRLTGKLSEDDAARLAGTVDQLDQTISEVRDTVRKLRESEPKEQFPRAASALFDFIRAEVRLAEKALGFEPELALSGDPDQVPVAVADHVRAALRESLSNVVRHSGAARLQVELGILPDELTLRVVDDGCGIPPGVTKRGLLNLVERAKAVGGHCEVSSFAYNGTTVIWNAPLG